MCWCQKWRHQQTHVQCCSDRLSDLQLLVWIFVHTGDRRSLLENQTGPSMRWCTVCRTSVHSWRRLDPSGRPDTKHSRTTAPPQEHDSSSSSLCEDTSWSLTCHSHRLSLLLSRRFCFHPVCLCVGWFVSGIIQNNRLPVNLVEGSGLWTRSGGGGGSLFHRHAQRTDVYQCVEFGADPNPNESLVNSKVVS